MFFFFFFLKKNTILFFFFFFQAEDGIRDYKVTGVQTCALRSEGLLGGGLARSHAVGDPDAPKGTAGQMQARDRGGAPLDRLDTAPVADVVLRHRLGPARDAREDGRGGDPERLA